MIKRSFFFGIFIKARSRRIVVSVLVRKIGGKRAGFRSSTGYFCAAAALFIKGFARQGFRIANTSTNAATAIAKSRTNGAKYEPVELSSAAAAVAENDENSSFVFEML